MKRMTVLFVLLLLTAGLAGCGRNPAVTPTAASGPDLSQPTQPEVLPTPVATNPAGDPVTLNRIHFWDSENGWGLGAVPDDPFQRVLRTADAGDTWMDVTPVGAVTDPLSTNTSALAAFLGPDRAWVIYSTAMPTPAAGEYRAWYTSDGGKTWQASQPLPLPETLEFFLPADMTFADANNGWALVHLGAGMSHDYVALYKTSDGGATWQLVVEPSQAGVIQNSLPMTCEKNGLVFQDDLKGWVTGGCNGVLPGIFLYETADGGITWTPVALPSPRTAPGLLLDAQNVCRTSQPDINQALVSVEVTCQLASGTQQSWLYATNDGGENWSADSLPAASGSIDLVHGGPAWMLEASKEAGATRTLFRSDDSGNTWQPLLSDLNWQGDLNFVDGQNGFALVSTGEAPRMIKTSDGGQTWVEVKPLLKPKE